MFRSVLGDFPRKLVRIDWFLLKASSKLVLSVNRVYYLVEIDSTY